MVKTVQRKQDQLSPDSDINREKSFNKPCYSPSDIIIITNVFREHPEMQAAIKKIEKAGSASGKRKIQLAKEALELSKDCAEAYMILAEEAEEIQDSIELVEKAVAAGERIVAKFGGHIEPANYWNIDISRPFVKALKALAEYKEEHGRFDEAIVILQRLLDFDPSDRRQIRTCLASCLFEAERFVELEQLLSECEKMDAAEICFTKALYLFKTSGRTELSKKAFENALQCNPHVLFYLAAWADLPEELPETLFCGEESEAIAYVMLYGHQWLEVEGAFDYMIEMGSGTMMHIMNNSQLRKDILTMLAAEPPEKSLLREEETGSYFAEISFSVDVGSENAPKEVAMSFDWTPTSEDLIELELLRASIEQQGSRKKRK